ncbi:hypothetical protein QNH18_02255 [Bacillus paralicheniformis]|uniref:hypothetical protein n=1 Tax=Bacillus TaxID=1386 RepID=UPI0003FBEF8B|nr:MULTISPECIES: hypothetical protein [Bacillus]MBL7477972.1 hypothetical protein [Bacillus paralicheniformis]MCJ8221766.1 hypothetical protein [Bacillus paralicheniformis]MCQ5456942.1 hypothetical protein [Bacillus paralicheniformis]MCU4666417.1 hypothetical protein [Bacillus paralicheniformis]MCW4364885.1 hypothetical protein [Bacillus paralicheniformis]
MNHGKDFLNKKINEAMIIFTILFPVVGIFFVIMAIWGLAEQAPSEIPFAISVISIFFFIFPIILHIYRKKIWLKKHPELQRKNGKSEE